MRVYAPLITPGALIGADLVHVEALPDGDLLVAGRAGPGTSFGAPTVGYEGAFVARLAPDGDARWLRGCDAISVAAKAHGDRVFAAFVTQDRGALGDLTVPSDERFDNHSLTLVALSVHDGQPLWHTQHEAKGARPYVQGVQLTVTRAGEVVVAANVAEVDALGEVDLGGAATSMDVSVSWWAAEDGALRASSLLAATGHVGLHGIAPVGEDGVVMVGDSRGDLVVASARFDDPDETKDAGYVTAMTSEAHLWTRRFSGARESSMHAVAATEEGVVVAGDFAGVTDFGLGLEGEDHDAGLVLFELDEAGLTRWVRTGRSQGVRSHVGAVLGLEGGDVALAVELQPDGAPTTGRLLLDGMVYPADEGVSAVLMRATPGGRIAALERWHADAYADEARPFALASRDDDLVVAGRLTGAVTLGEDRLTQPHGSIDPCGAARPGRGVVLARSFVDPCRIKTWYHWGALLRTLPGAASRVKPR